MAGTRVDRRHFLSGAAAFVAAGGSVAGPLARAGGTQREPPSGEGPGWVELFDGRSLDGWHTNRRPLGHGSGGAWQVVDGALTGEQDPPGSGNGGILLTDRKFGDFELTVDMRPDWGVCSGIYLRCNERGASFQVTVDYRDGGNVGQLYGERTGGFSARTFQIDGRYDDDRRLAGLRTSAHRTAAEAGLVGCCLPRAWLETWRLDDWNTARVRVEGRFPRITTWINDLQVSEFDGASSSLAKYKRDDVQAALGTEGSIALQVQGGKEWPAGARCRWKNIRLRRL